MKKIVSLFLFLTSFSVFAQNTLNVKDVCLKEMASKIDISSLNFFRVEPNDEIEVIKKSPPRILDNIVLKLFSLNIIRYEYEVNILYESGVSEQKSTLKNFTCYIDELINKTLLVREISKN
jgi:hypothetical protein